MTRIISAAATAIALSLVAVPVAAYQPIPVATLSKKEQKQARAASIARNTARVEVARQLKKTRKRELAEAQKAKKDTKSLPSSTRYIQLTTMEAEATARLEVAIAGKADAKAKLARRKAGSLANFVAAHDARALQYYNANNAAANRQAAAARQVAVAAATAQTSSASSSSTAQTSSAATSSTAQTSSAVVSATPLRSGANQFSWPDVPGANAQSASSSSTAAAQPVAGQLRRPLAAYNEPAVVRAPQGSAPAGGQPGGYTPGPAGNPGSAAAPSSINVGIYLGAPPQQSYATPPGLVAAVNRDLRQQAAPLEGRYEQPGAPLN